MRVALTITRFSKRDQRTHLSPPLGVQTLRLFELDAGAKPGKACAIKQGSRERVVRRIFNERSYDLVGVWVGSGGAGLGECAGIVHEMD